VVSDEQLMNQWQQGSDAAFAELEARYRNSIRSICRRLLLDSLEAEDAAQETFVKLWLARANFAPDRSFWPWLRTIALTTSLDRLRVLGRLHEVPLTETVGAATNLKILATSAVPPSKTDGLARMSELREALQDCWKALPPHQRALLQMIDWSDWKKSVKEVAEFTGRQAAAVRMSTVRYSRVLVGCLKSKGFHPSSSELLEALETSSLEKE